MAFVLIVLTMAWIWQIDRNKVRLQARSNAESMAHSYIRESLARALDRDQLRPWFLECISNPGELAKLHRGWGCWISIPTPDCMGQGATRNEILIDPSQLTISAAWTSATPVLVYRDTRSHNNMYYALYFGAHYSRMFGDGEPSQSQTFRIFTVGSVSSLPLEYAFPTSK